MTASGERHKSAVAAMHCIICGRPAAIHHVKRWRRRPGDDTGIARDDRYILPLCGEHHQTGGHGVAVELGVETWEAAFGTQAAWLDVIDERLAQ